jgi:hypothetical protein
LTQLNSPQTHKLAQVVPPPQQPHVEPRVKPKKTPKSDSPNSILFVNQRRILKFPQNTNVQLVTLFPVDLRVLPFSEFPLKKSKPQNLFNSYPFDPNLSLFSRSLIRGPPTDLILFVTRFNITHILIYFFIQYSFSHKFLKPY